MDRISTISRGLFVSFKRVGDKDKYNWRIKLSVMLIPSFLDCFVLPWLLLPLYICVG
jgi:hypothetical protein